MVLKRFFKFMTSHAYKFFIEILFFVHVHSASCSCISVALCISVSVLFVLAVTCKYFLDI